MRVELIDEGKPEKLNLEIEESYGDCGKKIQEIEAEFGNVSFITYIDYNIPTNKINMTTITNFESYDYTIVKYKKDVSSGQQCRNIMGLTVCTGSGGCKEVGPRTHKEENQESIYEVNTVFYDV